MKGGELELPPGFRFHPTDEELVMYYLCRKCASLSISVEIIAEIDLYKYDPWQLPGMALYGEKEWYFFSPRDRKYPNGSRPNRAAGSGYWKATGADKPIGKPSPMGIKKALVFYTGKAPRGVKTNWIMHEYRLANVDRSAARKKSNSRQLDEWVLCRLYNKKGVLDDELNTEKKAMIRSSNYNDVPKLNQNEMKMLPPPSLPLPSLPIIGSMPLQQHDLHYFDTSESVPRLHTDSSCSEHMVSPEFACEREVQSELRRRDWENGLDNKQMQFNASMDDVIALKGNPYESAFVDQNNQLSPLQDMFMFLDKPF